MQNFKRMKIYDQMMPAKMGGTKKHSINYRVPLDLEKRIEFAMENKEFNDQNDLITTALRFFFNKQDIRKEIRDFLESEEGKELIRNSMRR